MFVIMLKKKQKPFTNLGISAGCLVSTATRTMGTENICISLKDGQ